MSSVIAEATKLCLDEHAFLIMDIPTGIPSSNAMSGWMSRFDTLRNDHAAIYFPRVEVTDPLNENRPRNVGASGTLAGVFARTDATRGVWKAPAGTDATLVGARLTVTLTDEQNGGLNPLGINVLRNLPIFGNVSWGARTMDGADQAASEWKYIPVRRTALFIEESLYQGLRWVVFEPNDEPLWAQIRLNVGAFMHTLFRQGAFQGQTPREAYLVKCDRETTTQNDVNLGIVNILVGFAPLKPAEFVFIQLQQLAGQVEV
jgi:phage tail sheath protein FI